MKVKDAIKQLEKVCPDAELVVELDEFPNHFQPVMDFEKARAGDALAHFTFTEGVLERCERKDLKNIKSVVICRSWGLCR